MENELAWLERESVDPRNSVDMRKKRRGEARVVLRRIRTLKRLMKKNLEV